LNILESVERQSLLEAKPLGGGASWRRSLFTTNRVEGELLKVFVLIVPWAE